jgi:archaeal flagellar protein FlaJ
MLTNAAKIYPAPIRKKYRNLMKYCDIDINHEKFIGTGIVAGLILSLIISTSLKLFTVITLNTFIIIFFAIFFLVQLILYIWLVLRADAKGRFIEEILPDALLLMSMNIKSGMTTDRALIIAARPEFGPLEKALAHAGKEVLAGKEISDALLDLTSTIKSGLFERTVRLIIEGIKSGGELSSLLQQTAEDIQNTKLVQKEVRSNLLMYAIFIFFAVGFGAPMLFSISTYLVATVGTQMSTFQAGDAGGAAAQTLKVTPAFLTMFALIALVITSIFGGLIIGIIKGGSERAGLKIIPMLMVVSITVFFIVRMFVISIFPSV